jgi:hypothetical protein
LEGDLPARAFDQLVHSGHHLANFGTPLLNMMQKSPEIQPGFFKKTAN